MKKKIETPIGNVTVEQRDKSEIVITLSSVEAHPGKVTVKVLNAGNGDAANLIWVK